MYLRFLVLCGGLWALIACAAAPPPPPTATAPARIAAEEAGRLAIARVQGEPEMSPPLEAPRVTRAAQMTWAQAQERYGNALPELPAMAPATVVWVVELSGAWDGGMDALGITTLPTRYRVARVILGATTGQSVVTSYAP